MPPTPQRIGRYEILALVGRGGMGVLYRARDPVLERIVALKMMHVDFSLDQAAHDRFQREAKAIARLQHTNVVTVHELGEVDGAPYIVMEFLGGQDLEALLKSHAPLTLAQKLEIAAQLCEGLAYAHAQGIIHRDIKPGNVRVLEHQAVKILDFGIAKFAANSATQSGTVMGTPSYMAPEQITGQPLDGRADLFAAGVLLYELLSGKKPFTGDSPTAVIYQIMHVEPTSLHEAIPELPDALNEIVARALQKNPKDRYSNASEMATDLRTVRSMLDLPLHPTKSRSASDISAAATVIAPQLFARTPTGTSSKSVPPAALDTPMRASALDAAADAAPRSRAQAGRSLGLILGVAALVVAIAGLAVFALSSGGKTDATAVASKSAEGLSGGTAPPPPGPASFLVASVPAGARIVLNGVDTGTVTPVALTLDVTAPNKVELSLKGYRTLSASISDAELKAGSKEFTLAAEARPVRLTASAPYPFELVQGSQVISPAANRHELTIQPGAGVVARSKEYLLNSTLSIDFQRAQVTVTLPSLGTLAVFGANETCTAFVDGQDLGFLPIPKRAIAAGSHTVALKCPDGKEESRKISVTPGERTPVTFGR